MENLKIPFAVIEISVGYNEANELSAVNSIALRPLVNK